MPDPYGQNRPDMLSRMAEMVARNQANMDRSFGQMTYQQGLGTRLLTGVGRGVVAAASVPGGPGTPFTGAYGPMMSGQGIGALAYHAGLGQSINALTGGVFARSAGFAQGMPMGAMQQLSADELQLRSEMFFSDIASDYTLGIGDYFGLTRSGLRARSQRQISQMLAGQRFSASAGGTALGFGLRSRSSSVGGLASAVGSKINELYEESGRAMSREDRESLQSSALNVIGSTRLGGLIGQDPSTQRAVTDRTIEMVKNISESLQVSYEAAGEVAQSLSFALDPQKSPGLMSMLATGRVSGMSGPQYAALIKQQVAAARSMGAYGSGAVTSIAMGGALQSQGLFQSAQSGLTPMTLLSAWGGDTEADQRVRAMLASHRYGMGFGFSSPGIAAMYQATPGAIPGMIASDSLMGTMTAGASAMLNNPFAAMTARYSPRTLNRMRQSGTVAAYAYARQQGTLMSDVMGDLMNKEDRRAFRVRQYQRAAGIEDESRALASYGLLEHLEDTFEKEGMAFANRAISMGQGNANIIKHVLSGLKGAKIDPNSLSDIEMLSVLDVSDPGIASGMLAELDSGMGTYAESSKKQVNRRYRALRKKARQLGIPASRLREVLSMETGTKVVNSKFRNVVDGLYNAVGWASPGFLIPDSVGKATLVTDPRKEELRSLIEEHMSAGSTMAMRYAIADAGSAVDVLLAGTEGVNEGHRVGDLLNNRSLNRHQRAFARGLTKEGEVRSDAIWSMGPEAASSFLTLMAGSKSPAAIAAHRKAAANEAGFTTAMGRLVTPENMEKARSSYLAVYGNYNRSALTAVHQEQRGTQGLPLYVKRLNNENQVMGGE